jgi:hypothetical protein
MKVCPEALAVKVYNKVEQVLGHYYKPAPDYNAMEKAIEAELAKKKAGK